jgi:hypothetical protein
MAGQSSGDHLPRKQEEEAIKAIVDRASRDQQFRRDLLTDPRSAIERAYGVTIPSTYRIRFIEKGADVDALVVLPDFSPDGELSERDLEHVSGGAQHHAATWSQPIGN